MSAVGALASARSDRQADRSASVMLRTETRPEPAPLHARQPCDPSSPGASKTISHVK
ncbi:hypothetical protein BOS5A_210682 [Bosea sp. EC-HK365B]|nr:hypothetical protein BOSE7B_120544 [Bosea sp. 7B]CAD5276343.1 hypothetical protein BOSE21B_30369 [Bosea sp. 21B]VVT59891.1 hypothetical protein BOS5A_210682 [Bosea sp. EC-HK365B]